MKLILYTTLIIVVTAAVAIIASRWKDNADKASAKEESSSKNLEDDL